ncbi:Transcription factor bHLH110 [Platanthera zijinensis]|uniref:Transcription factor bHLH110 n=1 Tax=Platanthera zijinensis TaxID=2320716 RepID=A0AAP0AUA2_9ASPA
MPAPALMRRKPSRPPMGGSMSRKEKLGDRIAALQQLVAPFGKVSADKREEAKPNLRTRGLCLVPLSCTSYVTGDNVVWSPPNYSCPSTLIKAYLAEALAQSRRPRLFQTRILPQPARILPQSHHKIPAVSARWTSSYLGSPPFRNPPHRPLCKVRAVSSALQLPRRPLAGSFALQMKMALLVQLEENDHNHPRPLHSSLEGFRGVRARPCGLGRSCCWRTWTSLPLLLSELALGYASTNAESTESAPGHAVWDLSGASLAAGGLGRVRPYY